MSSLPSPDFYFPLFIVTIQLYNCQQIKQPIRVDPFKRLEKAIFISEEASLCLSNHQNRFLYSSSIQSNECSILCSFLASSSIEYINYYDIIETFSYNLPEKTPCELDSYCLSNICTHQDDFPGKAQLLIIDGYFSGQDRWTQTDTFIKVYSESKLSGFKYVGQTRIIHNNDKPFFLETFTTEISSKEGYFILGIFDYDSDSPNDLIDRVRIYFKDCLKRSECTKTIGKSSLRFRVEWIPQI